MPSVTLVLVPLGAVITTSYKERPGVRFAVFAAVIVIVISPSATLVTDAVKSFDVLE
jgi:hypothetical protein